MINIENLSFSYPTSSVKALDNISVKISPGDFLLIVGRSGCGKTTLLQHLKSSLSPHGTREGNVFYNNRKLDTVSLQEQATSIGYVMQTPESQIVTDRVWHEMAFGLENLGYPTSEIRVKIAETASYFGIENFFYQKTSELSGGQKQLLNLAAIMAMQPEVIVLDEPTAQLDPISAAQFLSTVSQINRDLGTTIILSEHRTEEIFQYANRVLFMDRGRVVADSTPRNIPIELEKKSDSFLFMPTATRIFTKLDTSGGLSPITINEGRKWLSTIVKQTISGEISTISKQQPLAKTFSVELKDIWFKYDKNLPYVLENLSLSFSSGEIHCILGGNGAGKTTLLNIIAGMVKPYTGNVFLDNKLLKKYSQHELYGKKLALLPQESHLLFTKDTVKLELEESFLNDNRDPEKLSEIINLFGLARHLDSHPSDLSVGEQQLLALGKITILNPDIILLDEPTKGLDPVFKQRLVSLLKDFASGGKTIIIVSHDLDFCSVTSSSCSLLFQGEIVTTDSPSSFFSSNMFYTTATAKISRSFFENTVTIEDLVKLYNESV